MTQPDTEQTETKQPDENVNQSANQVEALEKELASANSKYIYLYAEFENYKKRSIKERSDTIKYGWEPVARELLTVSDNLERALAHIPEGTDKTLTDGLNMIYTQFKSTLEKQGVAQLQAIATNFDPNLHEAIGQEPSDKQEGTVVRELSKGYTLHGRLLRPARVVISSGNNK